MKLYNIGNKTGGPNKSSRNPVKNEPLPAFGLPSRIWVESDNGGWYSLDRSSEKGKQAIIDRHGQ